MPCHCGAPSAQGGNYPDGLCIKHADEWCDRRDAMKLPLLQLTDGQRITIAWLLRRAADEFSNHGCNDFPELANLLPADQLCTLAIALMEDCGDEQDVEDLRRRLQKDGAEAHGIMDWQAMHAMADAVCPRDHMRDVKGRLLGDR